MSPEGEAALMRGYDEARRIVLDKVMERLRARRIGTAAVLGACLNQVRERRTA